MSLMVERLVTRCKVPRRIKLEGALLDRIAHEQFPRECARQLHSRWPKHGGVCRIRRLPVRLTVSLADLKDARLPKLWAAAFGRALAETLARPTGSGPVEVVRAENLAEWLARFIHDLLNGIARERWEYQEFQEYIGLSTKDAALAVFNQEPSEIVSVLVALEARGALDRLLMVLDELALEQLFAVIARENGIEQSKLSIADLLTLGRLLLSQSALHPTGIPTSRRYSLILFLALRRGTTLKATDTWSPRRVLHGLMSLAALSRLIRSAEEYEANGYVLANVLSEQIKDPLHPVVLKVLEEVRNLVQRNRISSSDGAGISKTLTELTRLLIELQPLSSAPVNLAHDIRWISSDCAGLFLLIGIIKKLGWFESIQQSALWLAYGPRALTYILAGVGLSVLSRFFGGPERLDPGLTLFAGWLGGPDLAVLQHFFDSGSAADRRAILTALTGETKGLNNASESWAATLDRLAERLIREFALRVRGFRKASRSFVVKNCLALPGRIGLEENRIVVQLTPSFFHVALHISSMDECVESVGWLGGRKIVFQLEGL